MAFQRKKATIFFWAQYDPIHSPFFSARFKLRVANWKLQWTMLEKRSWYSECQTWGDFHLRYLWFVYIYLCCLVAWLSVCLALFIYLSSHMFINLQAESGPCKLIIISIQLDFVVNPACQPTWENLKHLPLKNPPIQDLGFFLPRVFPPASQLHQPRASSQAESVEKTDKDKENKERGASKAKERNLKIFSSEGTAFFSPRKEVYGGLEKVIQTEKSRRVWIC